MHAGGVEQRQREGSEYSLVVLEIFHMTYRCQCICQSSYMYLSMCLYVFVKVFLCICQGSCKREKQRQRVRSEYSLMVLEMLHSDILNISSLLGYIQYNIPTTFIIIITK